ncbi:hypothetical protein AXE65_02255 [Ventosimonas gracilis]|uniref:YhdP central domain-containing protein n=1 Tax=Ventosimonas gracilis TaxID=1680762 RepID=A0A139SV21_9GAMM|nr:YhdP family protein [Ventosimonas gracilis]KXU38300.1 hypothetical protein AXE65_02255 [Ventosimonas gracilis]
MKPFGEWLLKLLRLLTSLCACALILLACWVSLGRELMPWLADYRAEVEALVSKATGEPVHIGRLEGRWQGFAPIFTAYQIEIGEGEKHLALEQLELRPDLIKSLLALKPRLAYTGLSGLNLQVSQDTKGSWQVAGFTASSTKPVDMQALASIFYALQAGQIILQDSRIQIQAQGAKPLVLSYGSVALSSSEEQPQLSARLHLETGEALLLRLGTQSTETFDWPPREASLYLKLPAYDWAPYLPAGLQDGVLQDGALLSQLHLGGQLWLHIEQSQWQRGALQLNAASIELKAAKGKALSITNLALSGELKRDNDGLKLRLDKSIAQLDGKDWGAIQLAAREQQGRLQVQADRLELSPLLTLLAQVKLPDTARAWLDGLKPRGLLRNLQLSYQPGAAPLSRLQFASNLQNVSISAYQHVPAAENLSGSIEGSAQGGELRFASEDFVLHVQDVFATPWRYSEAAGTLRWQIDEQGFALTLPYAKVQGITGEQAVADLALQLFWDESRESYLDLRIGIIKAEAKHAAQYLPRVNEGFPPALKNWLNTAIRAATVEEGYFQYQGSVHAQAPEHARVINLYLKAKDAELAFWPGFPSLEKTSAQIFVENNWVRIEQAAGHMLQSRFAAASAQVLPVENGKSPLLQVKASVKQRMEDLLHLLQRAPIGTGETFAGWTGSGLLDGQIALDIPLDGGKPQVRAQVSTKAAQLTLTRPALLAISNIAGTFAYDSQKGLSSPDYRAEALGHRVQGKIVASGKNAEEQSRIEASGQIAADTLQDWLKLDKPLPIRGTLPYRLALYIDKDSQELRIDSNLKGLLVDLPAPFGKTDEEERKSYLRLVLPPSGQKLWFASFGGLARLALSQGQSLDTLRGELLIGRGQGLPDLPRPPAPSGINLLGRLQQVDIKAWQPIFAPYLSASSSSIHSLLRSMDIRIDKLQAGAGELSYLHLQAARQADNWDIQLDSSELKGQLLLPSAKDSPIRLTLDYLAIPKTNGGAQTDALATFDPKQIPPLNVRIDRLLYDAQPLGAVAFNVRPNANGMQIDAIDLDIRKLKIGGTFAWENTQNGPRSRYQGRLHGNNLAEVLSAWQFAPNVTSEKFHLDVNGSWPGSPLGFSLGQFSGELSASLQKGQLHQVEGSAQALHIFGLLNFEAIGRRLRLDFSDLFDKGLSFDRLKGTLAAQNGLYHSVKPLSIKGPSSDLELNGMIDMQSEQVDATLQVMLPLTNNLPLAAVIAGAPAVGGALFVIDRLLGDQVSRLASIRYQVKGNLYDPKITPLKQSKNNTASANNASPLRLTAEELGEKANP